MTKFKLTLEYDGAPFVGWQMQDNGLAVQQVLETAVAKFCGEAAIARAAGRTDAGVHALGQVVDLTIDKSVTTDQVRDGVNYHMKPHPIAILSAEQVDDDFSSRFDAKARHYLYRIVDRRAPLTLLKGQAWQVPVKLDAKAMHEAAQTFVGQHDFTTFRAVQCQAKSPVKTVDRIDVSRLADEIHFNVSARSFLHHQVRSFVGTLVKVGEGKWARADVKQALAAKNRAACGPMAPAHGLYLVRVDY
jgi:tRNA pseudouridine38-40 synthase